jgi:hypothetical protein
VEKLKEAPFELAQCDVDVASQDASQLCRAGAAWPSRENEFDLGGRTISTFSCDIARAVSRDGGRVV